MLIGGFSNEIEERQGTHALYRFLSDTAVKSHKSHWFKKRFLKQLAKISFFNGEIRMFTVSIVIL